MFKSLSFLLNVLVLVVTFPVGCVMRGEDAVKVAAANSLSPKPTPTPKVSDPSIYSLSASSLCDRLGQIDLIHDRVPEESDDLYKAIIAKSSESLPCLIDKINDRTKTRDPRVAPKWQHYAVGDTALFTVLDIASQGDEKRWQELMLAPLPLEYREEWKTNGVYAYFNYVSERKNRNALQKWWQNWLKEKEK